MMRKAPDFVNEADRLYWDEFERRLATLPLTAEDPALREEIVSVAYSSQSHGWSDLGPTATRYAETVYRLCFELGPQISQENRDENARALMEQAADLLEAGVSPEHLGLTGEEWVLG